MIDAASVDKYFDDYKKLYEAIMRVQKSLNGPLLDKIGMKAQGLFNQVVESVGTPEGMSRSATIEFLKKLRAACLALRDLRDHLVQAIENQKQEIERREMEIDVPAPTIEEEPEIVTVTNEPAIEPEPLNKPVVLVKSPNMYNKAA